MHRSEHMEDERITRSIHSVVVPSIEGESDPGDGFTTVGVTTENSTTMNYYCAQY